MTTQTPEPTSPFTSPQPAPGYGPPFGEQPWPGKPPRSRRSVPLFVAVLVGAGLTLVSCLGGVAVGAAGQPAAKPAPAASTVTKTVQLPAPAASTVTVTKPAEAAPPPPPPPAPKTTVEDGTWSVGPDIPAGTYRITGAGDGCYWRITKSGSNGQDLLSNHFGPGNLTVTLKAGQDFSSERCGTWTKVG